MTRLLVSVLLFMAIMMPHSALAKEEAAPIMLVVKSSSDAVHQTELEIRSSLVNRALQNIKPIQKVQEIPFSTRSILVDQGYRVQAFSIDERGYLYDPSTMTKYQFEKEEIWKKLSTFFNGLEEKHFGELMEWEEVDKLIPRYTSFTILDLETGLSFRGQRRAGANHADVQPLTLEDTKIMKEIYGGKWSWARRAILIQHDGREIAASMHGMPHGGGALANGFPGHFCIHFAGSVTHKTKNLDLSHQVMIHKAAGLVVPFVKQQTPENIVHLLATAYNHNDSDLAKLIHIPKTDIRTEELKQIEIMRITKEHTPSLDNLLYREIPFTYRLSERGKKERELTTTFRLQRESPLSEWRMIRTAIN
ncbi:hypothetical protein RYX45_07270 [Alkalihalophilus pseudofirmus]|uniref:Uncharacterized protein n=1 Tax=Alkalihalophilus pseudofirmus TaxID=79885 RepID=A0AAJ2NMS4_ALKPS|nr:hypothetical protein [Alkalihalophilus pseudofirmus]MDV2884975.1 hypothetical protein [Alkalihalophilus pseudofirmus]